jgi:hypothetical protein
LRRRSSPADARVKVHGKFAAQRLKARMHFRRHRTCCRPRARILRPKAGFGCKLRKIVADRKAVPYNKAAMMKRGDAFGRRIPRNLVRRVRLPQPDRDLTEGNIGHLRGEPGTKAPRRPSLVANDQNNFFVLHGKAGTLLGWQGGPRKRRARKLCLLCQIWNYIIYSECDRPIRFN